MTFRPVRRREGASNFFKRDRMNDEFDENKSESNSYENAPNHFDKPQSFNSEPREDSTFTREVSRPFTREPRPYNNTRAQEPRPFGDNRSFNSEPRSFNNDRPAFNRDSREGGRPFDRDSRPPFNRDNRESREGRDAPRSFDRDSRPPFDRGAPRPFNNDRPAFNRDNREGGRPFDRDSRPPFNRDNRESREGRDAPRSFDRDSRPPFDRGAPRPFNNDRPAFNRDNREGGRPFDRDSRPPFNREGRDGGRPFDRDSRPSFDRGAPRPFDRESRPPREGGRPFDRDSRPPFNRDNREGGRPFDRDSRPPFNREGRSFNNDNRRPFNDNNRDGNFERPYSREGRISRFRETLDNLFDVDQELLRILTRRAELLQGVKRENRIDPALEKKLRNAWESGVARVTRDPRIARDFFNLLQQIEPIALVDGTPSFFNLAPVFKAVEIDIEGPVCARQLRMFFAIAAASGAMTTFQTALSPNIMAAIKAFNQLGGQLWWEGDGRVLSRGGNGVMPHVDKVIPVGDDPLTFYLVLALALLVPARLKLVGDGHLRFLDTSAIRHFLPQLNARMTTVIPGQEGIPVRIESVGMMPEHIICPADLPADFVISLVITSCFREDVTTPITFTIEEHPEAERIAAEVISVLDEVDIPNSAIIDGAVLSISVTPSMPVFPEDIKVELDPMLATTLLAIPAFAGGETKLRGALGETNENCIEFLKSTGLEITIDEGLLMAVRPEGKLSIACFEKAPNYPFALAFAALSALSGEEVSLPVLPEGVAEDLALGFLAQIGLAPQAENGNILIRVEVQNTPWFAPDALWGLALSLAAYMRPNIRIANPDVVSSVYPTFWRIYNGLPNPDLTAPSTLPASYEAEAEAAEITEEGEERHIPKCVIAENVFAEIPEPIEEDEDE